ncbi:MAG TPA: MBL fold metallo-hydrolase [Burkholderiaceae bacterium]|nr:MBL fold metallo-hydrolase [Burkholderiaceae bacterium]
MTTVTSRVRPDKYLHAWREPVLSRPAATILLLRDTPRGPEVLMTRRSPSASFAPGAYVFPGGVVDPMDSSPQARAVSVWRPDQPEDLLAYATAAVRESFEELGILLAQPQTPGVDLTAAIGQLPRHPDERFYERLSDAGLHLALDKLHWLSRWITDRDMPKRFDTRFFAARMPDGQQPTADETEQFEPTWVLPAEALERHESGSFEMIFPTIRTLRALARFGDVDTLLRHCGENPGAWVSTPRGARLRGRIQRFDENDLPFGELELVSPDGQIVHDVDWQHERPVRLLRHVQRLTAPNPGRMTGPGTNTWIIGEPGGYLVIDPGPDDDGHIRRIAEIVGDGLKTIVCTHAHPDHAPGAAPLKALTGAPILGRPTGPLFDPQWAFTPERTLEDGERLKVGDSTLRILHTPGHVSNHICLLLEEDGLLFSGDHILNGSTTVISPPDGDMRDYVAQLHRLADEPFDYILPAHGHVIASGKNEVARLIAHRMAREEKVLAALRAAGAPATLDELVLTAYDDVDPVIRPVAKRSLTAHLLKLRDDGVAAQDGEHWRLV